MGLTGMGSAVRYIPRPVVIGFTNGIALLIASTKIKDFFGLKVDKVPSEFFARMEILIEHFNTAPVQALLLGAAALGTVAIFNKYVKRVPGQIVALVGGTAVAYVFGLQVETIGSRFGEFAAACPTSTSPRSRSA